MTEHVQSAESAEDEEDAEDSGSAEDEDERPRPVCVVSLYDVFPDPILSNSV